MKYLVIAAIASVAFTGAAVAQPPGHEMQTHQAGSLGGPGASGYAPGHEVQNARSPAATPGASSYAPGHSTSNQTSGTSHRH